MSQSKTLFEQATQVIPGGVNSPVRAFGGVGGNPIFFKRGEGAYLIDVDNRRYVDYVGSWGPLILGHADPDTLTAITTAASNGISFGTATAQEITIAELLCKLVPSLDMVRLVNSGTEATMSAIRLARGYTGCNKIVKFEGNYHGHSDALLVKAGSGALTFGVPSSPGVPEDFTKHTLTATFNDLDSVTKLFEQYGEDIAAIIVEPVAGNMNCIPPIDGFLAGLRQLCDQYKSLLIFDEVMTGFRVALGGAQQLYNITPDLTTLGKVIGGGLPVGAFGGRKQVMQQMSPVGPVYQAGTLSGNPIAVAAGLATLQKIQQPGFYDQLNQQTLKMTNGILERAQAAGINMASNVVGTMFGLFFTDTHEVRHYQQVMSCDIEQFKQFFHAMLDNGVYLAPSAFEAGFMSAAHDDKAIEITLKAAEKAFAAIT